VQTKLTAAFVRRIATEEPPARDTVVFDLALPRFALRVKPPVRPGRQWSSWFFVRWVDASGRERKLRIGAPATHELDEARKAAKAVLRRIDEGADPAADRAQARQAWTIADAAAAYQDSADFARKTKETREGDAAKLRLHIVPHIGALELAKLDVPAVKRLLRAVETDKRTNARKRRLGGPGAARKTARVLSAMCSFAVGEGRLARHPLIGALRLTGDGERDTVIDRPEDYAALLSAMDRLVADGALRAASRTFIICAAYTGLRRGELRTLRWGQVDLGERRITLTSTKGAKLARRGPKTETVSLPPIAAAALAGIRPEDASDDDQVFVPHRGRLVEVNRDWLRVRDAAGLPGDLTLHGLRHSVGTVAIIAGMSTAEVQKLLRHRNVSTTSKYVHLADRARLQDRAMAAVSPLATDAPGTGEVIRLAPKGTR